MRSRPRVGLSILPADDLRVAQAPLFAAGLVEALEWTIDAEMDRRLPTWVEPLLDHYASAGALYAHGVQFSPLSAVLAPRQHRWLELARRALGKRQYQHLGEHFGFTTVPGFARSAPLPMPFVPPVVALGQSRLALLQHELGLPIGLENLALALSRDDATLHGAFLDQLLEPVNGFLLLDLHNVHCQAYNFGLAARDLVSAMPLERVRELHVSGGSWAAVDTPEGARPFRRDTHDGAIPEEVFALLAWTIPRCAGLEVVFVERLPGSVATSEDVARYQDDYRRVMAITTNVKEQQGG